MSSESIDGVLECKVCKKLFPKYDQRGYRNAGFTAHQNRCIERESALANPPIQAPVKRRRLLPAPPKDRMNVSELHSDVTKEQQQNDIRLTAGINLLPSTAAAAACTSQEQRNKQQHSLSENSSSTNDFQPVLHCNYCEPENGVHQVNCSIIRFVKDNSDNSI